MLRIQCNSNHSPCKKNSHAQKKLHIIQAMFSAIGTSSMQILQFLNYLNLALVDIIGNLLL